jgi:NAD(P)-dependent dehydrogenase (short-subunit alcohol dehydrogenase family)
MKKVLITGANKGIGYETARQFLQKGYHVFLGSRNKENGLEAVEKLKAEGLNNVEVIQLDVTNDESVKTARIEIGKKTDLLDILINNAGISGGEQQNSLAYSVDSIKDVFETNLYGPIRVTQAFIDLMQKSNKPRIVNLSSGLASQTVASDITNPFYPYKSTGYQSSKTALNMYTINLAFDLRETNFKVNSVCPGFTSTDINNHQGTGKVEDAAKRVIKYATVENDGPTGKFFCEEYFPNTECPW